jgi:UDP-N-acetylmuramate dehydrogenase
MPMIEPTSNAGLAPHTTLEVGGSAEWLVDAESREEVIDAVRWARDRDLPLTVLGGGSNVVVADTGVPGLTVRIATRGIEMARSGDRAVVDVAAGESWDDVVAACVGENLAGLECLSGIPGTAGATPIQNVGAYGQEVGTVIREVHVLDRVTLEERVLGPSDCGFGYRSSVLRRPDNPFIVLDVSFELSPGGAPNLSYAEVAERFDDGPTPSLGEVRAAVLELRRLKSMVIDDDDPNRRSAGSFFVNPVVDGSTVEMVVEMARLLGVLGVGERPPVHRVGEDRFKLSAGWLIEHAGFPRGCVRGRVGLSSRHALAVINRGGGSALELVDFATEIRRGVRTHLGVDLAPEPVFLGFGVGDPTA